MYNTQRLMAAQEDKSANFDEKFWVVNPILPSILLQIKSIVLDKVPFRSLAEPIVFNTVNILLDQNKERLFVKRSARQILEGNKIELLEFLTQLAERFGLTSILPPGPPENTFGVTHFQNKTVDKIQLFTGIGKTKSKFAEVLKWNDRDIVKFWKGKCQKISGTNGELYKPFPQLGKSIKVFLPQLCRSFDLDPVGGLVEIHDGLMALEYEISSRLLLGARNNPNNKCL